LTSILDCLGKVVFLFMFIYLKRGLEHLEYSGHSRDYVKTEENCIETNQPSITILTINTIEFKRMFLNIETQQKS
jgi:hypothetical protein